MLTLALVGCAPVETPSVRHPVPAGALSVCENCVGSFSGWSLAASNFGEHDAQLTFWVGEGPVNRVKNAVVGTTFALGATTYEVIEIDHHDVPGLVVLRAVPSASSPPPVATSMRIEVPPVELTSLEAHWDQNDMILVVLRGESLHENEITVWFQLDKNTVPGAAGRFEGTALTGGLVGRGCQVAGTISSPTIPAHVKRFEEPFDVDLDVTIDGCEPGSVLEPLVLRGHVRLLLSRTPPPTFL